jgi:MFS family permease
VPIRSALLLLAIVSVVSVPYTVLMPAFVSEILHGGPGALGWLMAASGVGALGGTVYLAARPSVVGLGRVMAVATICLGLGLIAFSLSRSLWLSAALLGIVGAGFIVQMAATNTVLQTIVDDRFRGRVMAFYTMAFLGTAPIGSLMAGLLAARIGAPITIAIGGAACIAAAVWFSTRLPILRALVRPLYIARGILPAPVAVDTGQKTL